MFLKVLMFVLNLAASELELEMFCNQFPEATFGNSVIVSIGRGPRKPGSFYDYF